MLGGRYNSVTIKYDIFRVLYMSFIRFKNLISFFKCVFENSMHKHTISASFLALLSYQTPYESHLPKNLEFMIFLSVCPLSVYPSIHWSIHLSICLSVFFQSVSIGQSIFPYACLDKHTHKHTQTIVHQNLLIPISVCSFL